MLSFEFGESCVEGLALAVEMFTEEGELREWLFRPLLRHCRSVMAKYPSGEDETTRRLLDAVEESLGRVETCVEELQIGKVEDQLRPFLAGASLPQNAACLRCHFVACNCNSLVLITPGVAQNHVQVRSILLLVPCL